MVNAIVNVKRADTNIFQIVQKLLANKDENTATLFTICTEHYGNARNKD